MDALQLSRTDLTNIGFVSSLDTLKLLPFGKHKRQSFVVGDDTGSLTCFQARRGESTKQFIVDATATGGSEICAVALGGSAGKKDKIFFSSGQKLVGVNRKGKEFFSMQSNRSEKTTRIFVQDSIIWTTGELTYTAFDNGKEVNSVQFDDIITSMTLCDIGTETLVPLIGCQEGSLHLVQGAKVTARLSIGSPVTAMCATSNATHDMLLGVQNVLDFGRENKEEGESSVNTIPGSSGNGALVIYGTDAGGLGIVSVTQGKLTLLWESTDSIQHHSTESKQESGMQSSGESSEGEQRRRGDSHRGAVNVIKLHDLNKDDTEEIIIGRDDGTVQVYSQQKRQVSNGSKISKTGSNMGQGVVLPPVLRCTYELNESIRGLDAGVVSSAGYDEIIVCTYSGNIISFSTEVLDQVDKEDAKGRTKQAVNRQGNLNQLRHELGELDSQLDISKKQIEPLMRSASGVDDNHSITSSNVGTGGMLLPVSHEFKVNQRLVLHPADAASYLSCELPVPMEMLALHSTVDIDLLDTDTNSAIVSITRQLERDSGMGKPGVASTKLAAVYRFVDSCKRATVKFRSTEGQYGDLHAIVIAKVEPRSAIEAVFKIRPLAMHQRLANPPSSFNTSGEEPSVWSDMTISGSFSLDRAHEWLKSCIPGVPERPTTVSNVDRGNGDMDNKDIKTNENSGGEGEIDVCVLYFENVFVNSLLQVKYKAGQLVFKAESISTLAIVREFMSGEASRRNIRVDVRFNINPNSVPAFLAKVDRKLAAQSALERQAKVLDALKEVQMDDGSSDFLTQEYQDILSNAQQIRTDMIERPGVLHALFGIVSDLYVDVNKFSGRNVNNPSVHEKLQRVLESYSLEGVLEFFAAY